MQEAGTSDGSLTHPTSLVGTSPIPVSSATDDGRSPEFARYDLGGQPASRGVAYTDCEDC